MTVAMADALTHSARERQTAKSRTFEKLAFLSISSSSLIIYSRPNAPAAARIQKKQSLPFSQ
jgi:hypothetical protein